MKRSSSRWSMRPGPGSSIRSSTPVAVTIGTTASITTLVVIIIIVFSIVPQLDALSVGGGAAAGSSSGSRAGTPTTTPPPFSSFQFAPNGVCVQPAFFADYNVDGGGGSDDGQRQQQQPPQSSSSSSLSSKQQQQRQRRQQRKRRLFTMRNVPGQGDCLFLAVALATACSMGLGANDVLLNAMARETRHVVASLLEQSLSLTTDGTTDSSEEDDDNNSSSPTTTDDDDDQPTTLVITGHRLVTARKLLRSAARECQLSETEYLRRLRLPGREGGLHGGGPELTVLTNVLRRPISVYELVAADAPPATTTSNGTGDNFAEDDAGGDSSSSSIQPIACRGVFGAGIFDDPLRRVPGSAVLRAAQPRGAYSWHLHILVVDSSSAEEEKHACVLLPQW